MHLNNPIEQRLQQFIQFLRQKAFAEPDSLYFDKTIYIRAFELTVQDVQYYNPIIESEEIFNRISTNQNELAVFLYRFGNLIYNRNTESPSLNILHGLMKELCSCEIYFSNQIDIGFTIVHGIGVVIGSRNVIGKGFKIYQNCTVGHKVKGGKGNLIGNNVICYAGSKIIGENHIGENCTIGANTAIFCDLPSNSIAYGFPLIIKTKEKN